MPTPNAQLRRERQLRGWSQAHLAQQIDVPDYYISRWERGDVFPSPYYQQKLCELFDKTAEELGMLPTRGDIKVQTGREAITDPFLAPHLSAPLLNPSAEVDKDEPVAAAPISSPLPLQVPVTQSSGEQWPFPSAPSLPLVLSPQDAARPAPKTRKLPRRPPLFVILLATILAVLLLGGGGLIALYSRASVALQPSSPVGHLYFLSSGQINDTNNQGITDQVQLELHLTSTPAAGNSDYAWLMPDEEHPEDPPFRLGTLAIHGGTASLSYSDPSHTNLLALTNRLLVTEENAAIMPLSPSTDTHTWRYLALLPHQVGAGQTYSFLDHLRHLLAADPKLHAHGLPGGLTPWLLRNVQAAYAQGLNAKEAWQGNQTANGVTVREYVTALLYYLEGVTYVQQGVSFPLPSASSLSLDAKAVSIGLLQMQADQDPPGYLDHITQHLAGLASSPGATPALRQQVAQILTAINTLNAWLQQARQDATQLLLMTDQQLQQSQVVTLLNDMANSMNNALVGQRDLVTGNTQEGAEWIMQAIEGLATIEINSYGN